MKNYPMIIAVCVMAFAAPVRADSVAAQAERAARLYDQGDFAEALTLYQELIEQGADNGHMLYNLGNVQFRLGQFGAAIASYREALLALPRDPDIRANLTLARKRAKGGMTGATEQSVAAAFLSPAGTFSHAEWVSAALVLYLLFWGVFVLRRIRPWEGSTSILFVLGLLFLAAAFYAWGTRVGADGSPKLALFSEPAAPAVVLNDATKVYSGDSENFQVIFMLDQGAEVEARESRNSWTKISLNEKSGWVRDENIRQVR